MAGIRRNFDRDNRKQNKYSLNNNENYDRYNEYDSYNDYNKNSDYQGGEYQDIDYNSQNYKRTSKKDYRDVYNMDIKIRVQDMYIQNLPPTIINFPIVDMREIDGVTTHIYKNGYAYHYYYGWIDLHTKENAKKYDVNKEVNKTKMLISVLSIGYLLSIVLIIALLRADSISPEIRGVLLTGNILYMVGAFIILFKRSDSRDGIMEDIINNGRKIKEPEKLREARLEANEESWHNKNEEIA